MLSNELRQSLRYFFVTMRSAGFDTPVQVALTATFHSNQVGLGFHKGASR